MRGSSAAARGASAEDGGGRHAETIAARGASFEGGGGRRVEGFAARGAAFEGGGGRRVEGFAARGASFEGGGGRRVGIVCPYTWDVPGGVQQHVGDLAEALIGLGHQVSVLAPCDAGAGGDGLPDLLVPAGRAVPVPYNGSVARLAFGVRAAARVRRWIREGAFDVLHVHEPAAPSLSLLACWVAEGPIVA